ncbi:hypothetical protein CRG98_012404 [Punica granatum]|uniref:Uncharacterized protein n=1 Tax=Punica granatum TaxID=22663 RepID=A0A2I0KFE4_PUNGR|nr:hypothetical protein CRG98_012404 [Punica granatum]
MSKFQEVGRRVFIILIVVIQGSSCLLVSDVTVEGGQGSFSGRRCDRASDFRGGVYAIRISWRVDEVLVCWWTLSRRGQEAERGVPYQDDKKICLGLVNVNDILADSMDCCRRRVEGLHGGIARCMVWCYRDCAIYGWGLPTQGCEFLEIERGSLGAGSVA